MSRIVIAFVARVGQHCVTEEEEILHRWRTYAVVFALIGMLVHAGLIVWHNAAMLGSVTERNALAAALGEICHGGRGALGSESDLPSLPSSGNEQTGCPICKGAVAGVAILPTLDLPMHRPDATSARIEVVGQIYALRLARLKPPSRAPPLPA